MSRSAQTGLRLADSLADLVQQEAVLLRAADFSGVLTVQERCAPVVAELAAMAADAEPELRARVQGILALRAKTIENLNQDLGRARSELAEIQASSRQVAKIGPAYGPKAAQASRIQFAL